jgi:NAD(P)-dependent dehydrogenase (short-subunit alcohol dehydrogenase family)
MSELSGKVIVVTGASAGIGHALCLALARQGARLVAAARDAGRLEQTAAACRAVGGEAFAVPTDVSEEPACGALIAATLARYGRLDALVNNAGMSMTARLEDVRDISLYERLMRVNYLGPVYLTWHALPALKQSGGRLVFVSSLAGLTGVPTHTAYAATKHALFGFADSLRIELTGTGVSVTVVAPDFVVSEIHRRSLDAEGRPLGRSSLAENHLMTSERCADEIVRAMAGRQRQRLLSLRGRIGHAVRPLLPGLIDHVAARAMRRGR